MLIDLRNALCRLLATSYERDHRVIVSGDYLSFNRKIGEQDNSIYVDVCTSAFEATEEGKQTSTTLITFDIRVSHRILGEECINDMLTFTETLFRWFRGKKIDKYTVVSRQWPVVDRSAVTSDVFSAVLSTQFRVQEVFHAA